MGLGKLLKIRILLAFFFFSPWFVAQGSTFAVGSGAGSPGMRFPGAGTAIPGHGDANLPARPGPAPRPRLLPAFAPVSVTLRHYFHSAFLISQGKIQDCCGELQAPEMRITTGLLGVCCLSFALAPKQFSSRIKKLV